MANKKISDLPLLAAENLNPSAAYIIVEQDGVTYKMPALGFGGSSGYAESLRDSKSANLSVSDGQTRTLTFNKTGINNTASAWTLDIVAENTENGNLVESLRFGSFDKVGQKRPIEITKTSGVNKMIIGANSYSTSANPNIKIGSFTNSRPATQSKSSYLNAVSLNCNYYVRINTSNNDKIELLFSANETGSESGYGSVYWSGIRANITATIDGTISA